MAKVLERSLYQADYYAWTRDQAAKLRALAAARVNSTLDLENLAEEVESLGRSELNTVRSQVRRIIEHLLKLEVSPSAEPRADWRYSIVQARDEVEDHLTASMRPDVAAELVKLFGRGRRDAALGLREARRARGGEEPAQDLPLQPRADRQPRLVPRQPTLSDRRPGCLSIDRIGREMVACGRDAMIEQVWKIVLGDIVYIPLHDQVIVWATCDNLEVPVDAFYGAVFRAAPFR